MFEDIKIFLYGPEKEDDYLSPLDFVIELECLRDISFLDYMDDGI